MSDTSSTGSLEEQYRLRLEKQNKWRQSQKVYPNQYKPSITVNTLVLNYQGHTAESLEKVEETFEIAGRLVAHRRMGRASFIQVQDNGSRMQVYCQKDMIGEPSFEEFKQLDLGDVIWLSGTLFRTKTNELTLKCHSWHLLSKCLRPLPDKYHGLHEKEQCYRKRYLDVLVNEQTRRTFEIRFETVRAIRHSLDEAGFLEVETPMMHAKPGGATAKPFVTHHQALDLSLYMRCAPELYLKRLIVGGFNRVYELNRNFRNEGLSTRHNPEFTMVEYYQAYGDYQDLMDLTENLIRQVVAKVMGDQPVMFKGKKINFKQKFSCFTLDEVLLQYHGDVSEEQLADISQVKLLAKANEVVDIADDLGAIKLQIFEKTIEKQLMQPTFITGYPISTSPLARRNDQNPEIADRFELFVGGQELANGYSELNDPQDQASRFQLQAQAREQGDQEAMMHDEDFVEALEYAMPPTGGTGIGIDRLVMLLTNASSIKDVILFPLLKPNEGASSDVDAKPQT
jgi:lysyl-tRNA synthetase class 2